MPVFLALALGALHRDTVTHNPRLAALKATGQVLPGRHDSTRLLKLENALDVHLCLVDGLKII